MAGTIRYGQPVKLSEIAQSLRDFDKCVLLDGVAGYLNLGTGDPFTGNNFFISMWLKWFGSTGTFQHILAKRTSYGATTQVFDLHLKNTTNEISVDTGGAALYSGYVPPVGRWIHLCYVHDGRDHVYVDCQQEYSTTDRTLGTGTTAPIIIGATDTPKTEFFNGMIDELVIGIGNPTWKDIVAMRAKFKYTSDANSEGVYAPWGYWKMDEGSGTDILDSSGNARHGTSSGIAYSASVALKA